MQINSEYPNYTPTYSGTIQSHQKAQDFTPSTGSRWDTKDTVEISLSETAPGPKGSWTWGGEPSAGYIAERKSGIKYTDEELKDVKERIWFFMSRSRHENLVGLNAPHCAGMAVQPGI